MIVLGIDPGSYTTGYAFLEKDPKDRIRVLEYGTISPKAKDAFEDRLVKIVTELETLVDHYKPDSLSMESAFFAKNVRSSMVLGHVRGAILVLCRRRGMMFSEFSPRSVKQAVTGNGAASKEMVASIVQCRLGLKAVKGKLDATDALAVACTELFPETEILKKTPPRKSRKNKDAAMRSLILKMGGVVPK